MSFNILLMQIFYQIVLALMFTILLEYFIIIHILKIDFKLFVFTNILTNVTANIIVIIYDMVVSAYHIPSQRFLLILIIECLVFVTEGMIYLSYYQKKNAIKVLCYTFLANLLSAYAGNIILKEIFIIK